MGGESKCTTCKRRVEDRPRTRQDEAPRVSACHSKRVDPKSRRNAPSMQTPPHHHTTTSHHFTPHPLTGAPRRAHAMAAPTVYSDVAADANLAGQLFDGIKFFVVQRCPFRSHYLETIKNNGGQVVSLEKHSDYVIADHLRKDAPPGSISYEFIDHSVREGALARPEAYPAGPPAGGVRDAGSSRPTKAGRAAYTADEDRILYEWVRNAEEQGGGVVGNEIYKQLQLKVRLFVHFPRHRC